MTTSIDTRLLDLLPHRSPMLLLTGLVSVTESEASSEVFISQLSPFFISGKGVPSWIGLEYMGQTAALIAGHQLQKGTVEPHTGFLLGTRKFNALHPWYKENTLLNVSCKELAVVGDSLATFDCVIKDKTNDTLLAQTKLSVFRKLSKTQ